MLKSMQNNKYIRFNASWWHILRTCSDIVREEVVRAICVYVFDNQEPEFTNGLAAGIFVNIRIEIDAQLAHTERVREAHRRSASLGAQKTNAMRWGEIQQMSANVGKCQQMPTNADNLEQKPSANADKKSANTDNNQQMSANADNGAPPAPPTMQINNIYNYILTHHDDGADAHTHTHAYEMVVGWLTDNEETLKMLFWRARVTVDKSESETLELIAQYIDEYFEQNEFSTDWERKGRTDTKKHFASWVRKHKTLEDNGTAIRPSGGKPRTTAQDAYIAALRGISLADAERNEPTDE